MARFFLQLLWCGAAVLWSLYRLHHNAQIDLVLIELIAGISPVFLMGQRAQDYGYLFLSSVFMLIYGALLPRLIFLGTFATAYVACLLILYYNRPKYLSGNPGMPLPGGVIRRNWHFFLLHILISLVFFWVIFDRIPFREQSSEGVFAVSFFTEKDSILPPDLRKWLRPNDKIQLSGTAKAVISSGKRPTTLSPQGAPLQVKGPNDSKSAAEGNGGAAMGRDLVFRVKSPVKLYHLAQLYDRYDGLNWTATPQMMRHSGVRSSDKLDARVGNHVIDSSYSIEKWISPQLYAPYRPLTFAPVGSMSLISSNFYSGMLRGKEYPALPFRYTVSSKLYLPVNGPQGDPPGGKVDMYLDILPRKHYLALPGKKISKRLRDLVAQLTANAATPYDKAIALRDYLRNNYAYKLYSDKTPEGKEPVDYFVFELKAGHCEYFSAAMTVMARLAGLPARVATGFSPGNYNTLTNLFEVHEYHAHAWSQVFIEDCGWLTLDAAPPGSIPSETKPLGIGKLRDPFGDEWRITPPELTQQTLKFVGEAYLKALQDKFRTESKTDKLLTEAALAEDRLKETLRETYKKALAKTANQQNRNLAFRDRIANWLDSARLAVLNYTVKSWRQLLPLLGIAVSVYLMIRILRRALLRRRLRQMADVSIAEARAMLGQNNALLVRLCLRTILAELRLAYLPRRRNQELIDYALTLPPELAANAIPICRGYYAVEYGAGEITRQRAESLLHAAESIRKHFHPAADTNR